MINSPPGKVDADRFDAVLGVASLPPRHQPFQLAGPILDDVHLSNPFRRALARLEEHEMLAAGTHVVRARRLIHGVRTGEEFSRNT